MARVETEGYRALEFLTSLGIHILDSNLAGDSERIEVLPVMERLALERWNHLYDLENHKKLTKAIIRDSKQQYNEYKRSKLM